MDTNFSVISTTVIVISNFLQLYKKYFPSINFIFSQSIDYEIGFNNRKNWKISNDIYNNIDVTPALLWNREPLRMSEPLLDRGRKTSYKIYDGVDQADVLAYATPNLEIKFAYITNSLQELELIEAVYTCAMQDITSMKIEYPTFGEYSYTVDFKELDELTINKEGSSYYLLASSATIQGAIFVLVDKYPILKDIVTTSYSNLYPSTLEISSIDYTV